MKTKTRNKNPILPTALPPAQRSTAGVYRVWVEQVNQTYLDVRAASEDEALEKGYRAWRKGYAHSRVSDVRKQ